ncbi:PAS domain-containing protein [bacterium]|nr:PAS domain-containing protein [bacterium]
MFQQRDAPISRSVVGVFACVLGLSLTAGGVTIWLTQEVRREQEIIGRVLGQLPKGSTSELSELPGELRWQFWLSLLVLLNGVATILALVALARAYLTSQNSLYDVRALATDILSSMDQSVITTDSQGIVTSFNPRTRVMYKVNNEGHRQPIESLIEGDTALAELCRTVLASHEAIHDRDTHFEFNGTTHFYRADCCPVHDPSGRELGTVLYVRDVTERVLSDDRMRRMERYMGLGSLAAGLHHEIKNPLGALSLHVQLLGERLEEIGHPDDVLETLAVLETEVRRIANVLESFRSFASISYLSAEPTQPAALVGKVVRLIKPKAELQHVTIRVEQSKPLPQVSLDPGRMDQVLLNLVLNALDAMPHGGELTIRISTNAAHLLIEIQDTGRGIPENVRNRIFDPYFTTKGDGTGMGLPLCEKIIRQHNGELDFETSTYGTTFRICLPLDQPSLASEPEAAVEVSA